MNTIAQIKTVPVDGDQVPTNAMMMAVNIGDPATGEAFVSQVMEQFKLHRMTAPPNTSMLLVTIIGGLTASQFAALWHALDERDDVTRAFMSHMQTADVIQGTKTGQQLSQASLLPTDGAATEKPWWKFW